ncbi:MAG: transporter substrate-binding domain-containing protein [Hahellaceae bacterium]|nr:transporter substrate-binding domain-containing protein [Hahellaceae bacterium]MCP5169632.1 transporter substrate-binding domain-containing protein [Hahellaceae bacterium]
MLMVASTVCHAKVRVVFAYEDKAQVPYYLEDSTTVPEKPGAAVELVKSLETLLPELSIELRRYPWKRCLSLLQSGELDGIFNASFNHEREVFGVYPFKEGKPDAARRITSISYALYSRGGNPLDWNGQSFGQVEGVNVGAPLGFSIVKDLRKQGLHVQEFVSSELSLRMLTALRVDAVALQEVTGDYLIQSKPDEFSNIYKVAPLLSTKAYYLMLSKQFMAEHPELGEQIWDAIGTLRENTLPRLLESYM